MKKIAYSKQAIKTLGRIPKIESEKIRSKMNDVVIEVIKIGPRGDIYKGSDR